jgi:LysR family hydrogen peroxide-inducible transcriptional activator
VDDPLGDALADSGGFGRAAELCHVSQPSLSAQIAEVEAALGVRLFERDRRHVLLTRAGEVLVGHARRLLTEADDLVAAARHLVDPLTGTLRIGVIATVAPYLLAEIVPALRRELPRLTPLWSEAKTGPLLDDLAAGSLDAVLLALVAGTDAYEHQVVGQDDFVLAGPPGHPLLRPGRPADPRELEGTEILLLEDGHCFRDQALELCTKSGAAEGGFRATSLATLVQVVAGGGGVTLLPSLALAVENRHGELAVRRFRKPGPRRAIALAWRRHSPLAPALRRLAQVIEQAYPLGREPDRGSRARMTR